MKLELWETQAVSICFLYFSELFCAKTKNF